MSAPVCQRDGAVCINDDYLPSGPTKCTWTKNAPKESSPHSKDERRRDLKIYPDVFATIGNTPIIKLNRIPQAEGVKCDIYVKCELFNPGGSVKDRVAIRMVEDAEREGRLKPGYTIIEPTSGNTGIGLAMVAAIKGYRMIIVMQEKISFEKEYTLIALGAEIIRTPLGVAASVPEQGIFAVAYRLNKEIPNSVVLNQFKNASNPLTHYDITAEEILYQMDGKVDMLVGGNGTGGTMTGLARKFKEVSPRTEIVAADPEGSQMALPASLNETDVTFFEVEGMGYEFIPKALDRSVIDRWIKVNDQESLPMARRMIREEGLLIGASSGAALAAAIKAAKNLEAGKRVLVILADSIRNYLTKFVSDHWMEARGLQSCINTKGHWWWDINVTSLKMQKLTVVSETATCEEVFQTMRTNDFDQIPVTDVKNDLIGVATLHGLTSGLISGKVQPSDKITKCVVRLFSKLPNSANLGLVSRVLEKDPYVVIFETQGSGLSRINKPIGVVNNVDLIQYISANKQ